MITVSVEEAMQQLADLLDEVSEGEEIVIVREDGEAFRLVPIHHAEAMSYDDDDFEDEVDEDEEDFEDDDDYR